MKVKELIKELESFNPELEIGIFGSQYLNTNLKLEILNAVVTENGIEYSKRQYPDTIKVIDIDVIDSYNGENKVLI